MIEAVTAEWALAMERVVWQGGLAIVLVAIGCRLWSALPPALHCGLWRLVQIKLLFLFIWSAPLTLPILPGETVAIPAADPSPPVAGGRAAVGFPWLASNRDSPFLRPSASRSNLEVGRRIAMCLWLMGFLISLGALVRHRRSTGQLRRGCVAVEADELFRVRDELCQDLGLRTLPALLVSDRIDRPLLVGVRWPAVLLPHRLLCDCGPDEQRMILAHELAHLKRRDLEWAWLSVAVRSLFFFHPLVWLADSEARLTRELACDDLTLRVTGNAPGDYGRLLLKTSSRVRPRLEPLAGVGFVSSHAALRRRLRALSAFRSNGPRGLAVVWAAMAVLALATLAACPAVGRSQVRYLDLRSQANQPLDASFGTGKLVGNDLTSLPRGVQVLAGFRFHVQDDCIQLSSRLLSERPSSVRPLQVGQRFANLAALHGTLWGGAAAGKSQHVADGARIAEYTVHYADGAQAVIPILYGEDVRDWWAPTEIEAEPIGRGRAAWTGQSTAARNGGAGGLRLYATSWTNPRPDELVTHIELASRDTPAAPFCVAITCGD